MTLNQIAIGIAFIPSLAFAVGLFLARRHHETYHGYCHDHEQDPSLVHGPGQALARALGHIIHKLDPRAIAIEIRALAVKWGPRFAIAAILLELTERIAIPALIIRLGHPVIAGGVAVGLHLEAIVYPLFFLGFKTWDRVQNRD